MSLGVVSQYSIVHARARAFSSTLLGPEVWERLYAAKDYAAVIGILRGTLYGAHLAPVEEAALSPRRAVYQLKGRLAQVFSAIIRLAPRHAQPLLAQLYRQFEVDNLKAALRGLMIGDSWDHVRYFLFPLGKDTLLPIEALVRAGSMAAAVDLLRKTSYYPTLAHAMERYTAEQSLFPLEVALDLDYWRQLWRGINQLKGRDRDWALRLAGRLIDMSNLMWALRYRVYHKLSAEEIIDYTLPFGYRLADEDVRAIAAGADMAAIVAHVYPGIASVRSYFDQPEQGLAQLEVRLQQDLAQECRAAFIGYPFHIGIPLAYLLLGQMEIHDLTVLIEAKAMQIPVESFQQHLVIGRPLP